MAHLKKISSTLSVAATVLLEACSSGGGGSSTPDAEANTTAPLLIGDWQTACTITTQGTATTTGSSGGGGSISGGQAFIANASFTQDGHADLSAEYFSSTDCNTNTSSGISSFDGVYFIGNTGRANDGSDVTAIDISDSRSTTFSIFQIVNGVSLYLGIESESSPGNDGNQQSTRHDGLGERYTRK